MKLFLAGGGGNPRKLNEVFAQHLDTRKKLLYIPVAIDTENFSYASGFRWVERMLSCVGIHDITMWDEGKLKSAKRKDFDDFSSVFIGGGITSKLIIKLAEFGTLDVIRGLADRVPIYGSSAGAILLGNSLDFAAWNGFRDDGLDGLETLGLVDYAILPHYVPRDQYNIRYHMKQHNVKRVIGIPENSGVCFLDDKVECAGEGVRFFEKV